MNYKPCDLCETFASLAVRYFYRKGRKKNTQGTQIDKNKENGKVEKIKIPQTHKYW